MSYRYYLVQRRETDRQTDNSIERVQVSYGSYIATRSN